MGTPRSVGVRAVLAAVLAASLLWAQVPTGAAARPAERAARRAHSPTGRVVMRFEPSAPESVRGAALARAGVAPQRSSRRARDMAVVLPAPGESPARTAVRLMSQPGVLYAAPEGRVAAAGAMVPPDDTRYADQRGYLGPVGTYPYSIDLEPAWDRAFNGPDHRMVEGRSGVRIAIVDSGVTMAYLESTGEYTSVWDYVERDSVADDDNGHGTAVASIMRAQTANAYGIAGVLHTSANQILVYKVLAGNGEGETANALAAIMDAADRGAKVINCSLGEPLYDEFGVEVPGLRAAYTDAVRYAGSRGAVVVAAAGNYYGSTADPWGNPIPPEWWFTLAPAAVDPAIAVGSIDPATGLRSPFSNFGGDSGNEIDLVAAGERVWSLRKTGAAQQGDGTSYATPMVSASLAFLWSLASQVPSATVTSYLLHNASSYPSKLTTSGYGMPRVWSSYQDMIATLPEQASVSLAASAPAGRETTLSWTAADGTGVSYEYGEVGGPVYATSGTTARLVLSAEGTRTVYVRSFATDRWSRQTSVTATVTVGADGLGPLDAARLAGSTRYRTAVSISRSRFPTGAPAVVVASGRNWPDALAAAPLAAAVGGPLLLTDPASLTHDTRSEIWRLRPSRIFIAGGTAAVDTDVRLQLDSLQAGDTVTRIAGSDRYQTAALIASRVASESGGSVPGGRAFVCSGAGYADALSGAAVASFTRQPILLTPPSALSGHTASAISSLSITDTVVLGGTAAVSAGVLAQLPSPDRVFGATRYDTSRALAEWARTHAGLSLAQVGIARGDNYPDALGAGVWMAGAGGPLVLVPQSMDSPLRSWLAARGTAVGSVTFFGGPAAVSYGSENSIRLGLRGQ